VVWVFNIVGTVYLVNAFYQGNRLGIGIAPGLRGCCVLWNYLDITALGRQEEWEDSPQRYPQTPPHKWWNWHDEYGYTPSPQWSSVVDRSRAPLGQPVELSRRPRLRRHPAELPQLDFLADEPLAGRSTSCSGAYTS